MNSDLFDLLYETEDIAYKDIHKSTRIASNNSDILVINNNDKLCEKYRLETKSQHASRVLSELIFKFKCPDEPNILQEFEEFTSYLNETQDK